MSVTINHKVKIIRLVRNWRQEDLAQLAGTNRRTLVDFETGKRISAKTIRKIEAAFGHPAGWLVSPEVEAAFVILGDNTAPADKVRLALALLENGPRALGQ